MFGKCNQAAARWDHAMKLRMVRGLGRDIAIVNIGKLFLPDSAEYDRTKQDDQPYSSLYLSTKLPADVYKAVGRIASITRTSKDMLRVRSIPFADLEAIVDKGHDLLLPQSELGGRRGAPDHIYAAPYSRENVAFALSYGLATRIRELDPVLLESVFLDHPNRDALEWTRKNVELSVHPSAVLVFDSRCLAPADAEQIPPGYETPANEPHLAKWMYRLTDQYPLVGIAYFDVVQPNALNNAMIAGMRRHLELVKPSK